MEGFCGICNEISGNYEAIENEEYESIVRSGRNVILREDGLSVIPSFGPLCESHVLIVTNGHFNNFSVMSGHVESGVSNIIKRIREYVRKKTGMEMVFFESGAGSLTNHSGGCVIHAHIHGVFYSKSFEERIFEEIEMVSEDERSVFDKDFGYVWYQNKKSENFYCNKPLLPSQFLRFLYIEAESGSSYWNWRRDIDLKKINGVINFYGDGGL